jgi:hypothetical protein
MCIYENELLQCAIEFIKSRGHAIRCLTFDGNNYYHDNFKELLQFIASEISRNFEDSNIEFDYINTMTQSNSLMILMKEIQEK